MTPGATRGIQKVLIFYRLDAEETALRFVFKGIFFSFPFMLFFFALAPGYHPGIR